MNIWRTFLSRTTLLLVFLGGVGNALASDSLDLKGMTHLSYNLDGTVPSTFAKPIVSALTTWADQLGVSVERCQDEECKQPNVIQFRFVSGDHGDRSPFEVGTAKVAHVVSSKSSTMAPEVHFNAALFAATNASIPDVYTVALHEIGHALGLSHSADLKSVMYPIYRVGGCIVAEELRSQLLVSRFTSPAKVQAASYYPIWKSDTAEGSGTR